MDIGQSAYHMLYLAVAVTNVIILAAAVSCIGSSFAISMEEKRKSYGMLASVGATPRQIRQSVYYEAFLTGRTAIPWELCWDCCFRQAEFLLSKRCCTGRIPYSICMFMWHGRCLSPVFYSQLSLLFFPRAVRQNRRQKFSGCGNARAGKEKPPGKKRTITAAIAGCTALFILVSYFMGVQTISVGQSNHMFDDHANVSVDVQEAGR